MNEAVAVATDIVAPPVDAQIDAPDDSLAAHEAQYGKAQPAVAEESTAEPPKHRAKSQRAGASDYDDIAKYTKLLRETEEGIDGFTLERNTGESDRVFNLRKRVEIAKLAKERRIAEPQTVARPAIVQQTAQPIVSAPGAFTESEPALEQFQDKPDPYAAWTRALAAFDRRKEAFEAQQEAAKQHAAATSKQADDARAAQEATELQAHQTRLASYLTKNPQAAAVFKQIPELPAPPLLIKALTTADNGPELVYTLATRPQFYDEAYLLTDGKPVTEQAVASTQRWLSTHSTPVVSTGATAGAAPLVHTPRPPTPVRTGPIASGDDLPGDESSLAEHEKAYGPRRSRRR